MDAPVAYPLQWCGRLDCAYWQINVCWCLAHYGRPRGWEEWQARKPMSAIIPVIDWLLDTGFRPWSVQ